MLLISTQIIAEKLNGSAIQAFWSGTSFLLTATVFQPTFASLSHVFGRREMLLVALTLFTIGSVIGGAARNFTDLLIGRCIQGTGGGGISALTYIIATDMVSLRERGKWFGLITMMWALGSVTGPIIGGAFAQGPSWVRTTCYSRSHLLTHRLSAGSSGSICRSAVFPMSQFHCFSVSGVRRVICSRSSRKSTGSAPSFLSPA